MNIDQQAIREILDSTGMSADISTFQGDTSFKASGIDSLEMMGMFLAVEERYGIKIPDEDLDALDSIDDLIAYLQQRLSA